MAGNIAGTNSLLRQIDDSLTDHVWERSTVDKDAAQLIHASVAFRVAVVGVGADVMRNAPEAVVLGRGHSERRHLTTSYGISIHQEGIHLGHHPSASYIERHDFLF